MAKEDFSGYTELDPNSQITVTPTRVTWADLQRIDEVWVYKDKGVDYFDGDFTHYITVEMTSGTADGRGHFWSLTNAVDDLKDIDDASGSYLTCMLFKGAVTSTIVLNECDSGALHGTECGITLNTVYYLKIVRDEAVGAHGTLYCYIYSDAERTDLLDTLTRTLHSSKKDFRYIFATNNRTPSAADRVLSGYCEDLWLSGAPAAPTVTTQACTDVEGHSATGNGNVTSLGDGTITAHGHCWATVTTPTLANIYNDNGAKGATGAFTSAMTEMGAGLTYYVRAYATSEYGTTYGNEVQCKTPPITLDEGKTYGGRATFAAHYVLVDWDNDDDFVDQYEDITADVISADITRGKDRELARAVAGYMMLTVKNGDHKYSPPNTSSVLNTGANALLPGRKVLMGMTFPYDEFTDADDVTLTNHSPDVPYDPASLWSEEAGTWLIDTNQAKGIDAQQTIAVMETGEKDAHIMAEFKKGDDNDAIICFRYKDIENYLEVRTEAAHISVMKLDSNVYTNVARETFAWTTGDTKTVKVILHGKYIYVLVDGALKISTESTLNVTETKHGMGGSNVHDDARWERWGCNFQLFYGTIDRIIPNLGPSERTAYIECSDDFKILAQLILRRRAYPISGGAVQLGQFLKELLVNDATQASQRGSIIDTTQAVETFVKPFWKVPCLEACHQIESEENGFFYQDPDGLWRFEAKGHRAATPHDAARCIIYGVRATNGIFFTGMKWRSGEEDVRNQVSISVQRSIDNLYYCYEEVWRCDEADVVDGGIASSEISIPGSSAIVMRAESKFYAINLIQTPSSSATQNKITGTIAGGPFEIGERVDGNVSGDIGQVLEQGNDWIIVGQRYGSALPSWNAGDTLTGVTSGATINGAITITTIADYAANAAADGSGADKTAQLTVAVTSEAGDPLWNWGKGAKITLTNADAGTIYVTKLRLIGYAWKLAEPVTYSVVDSTSEGKYGNRSHDFRAELLTLYAEAKILADDIEGKEDDPRAKVDITMVNSTKESLMQILARRLSDRVTVNWSDMGLDEDFYINKMRHVITDGGMNVICEMSLEEVA